MGEGDNVTLGKMIQVVEVQDALLQRRKLTRGRENDEEVKAVQKAPKRSKHRHQGDSVHAAEDNSKISNVNSVCFACCNAVMLVFMRYSWKCQQWCALMLAIRWMELV